MGGPEQQEEDDHALQRRGESLVSVLLYSCAMLGKISVVGPVFTDIHI